MNENAQALYDDLLGSRLREFCMKEWAKCGSPSCIGGHAAARMGYIWQPTSKTYRWLGIDEIKIHDALFYPTGWENGQFDYEPDEARNPDCDLMTMLIWGHVIEQNKSPYDATQPEAAEALRRACALMETSQQESVNSEALSV